MIFSTQYYKPPFPRRDHWKEDLDQIAATGFKSLYLSLTWAWIESAPGTLRFDDYDEIIDLAGAAGLSVIPNLFPEIQPPWTHRVYPDASMIDHMGRPVVSSQLSYFHFGVCPGCCTDHSGVRSHVAKFLTAVTARYADVPHIQAWDCWNEMRWMTQADGHACFCEPTLARFRAWLAARYGTLDNLNQAWARRYATWNDVLPLKSPGRTYTDAMAWQQFIADRMAEDLRWRYECVRAADPRRPIVAHGAFPSTYNTGEFFSHETALGRGNDWQLARQVDAFGCSHFPAWFHPSPLDYGARLESGRCAAGGKPYWVAELQGGAAGHGLRPMTPVTGSRQARWVWNAIARGAKAVNFWCWRDEGFGRESGGFGIIGDDGYSADRLRALRHTAELLDTHSTLFDRYEPAQPAVGVVFEPNTYYLDWAAHDTTGLDPGKDSPYPAGGSLQGYLRGLERLQVPYDVLETSAAIDLSRYRLLILPWPLIVNEALARQLVEWVHAGGVLLTEASLDAFDELALFRPPSERPLARALGFRPSGRRPLDGRKLRFTLGGFSGKLHATRWCEEVGRTTDRRLSRHCIVDLEASRGRVLVIPSFVGYGYSEQPYADFELFLDGVLSVARATTEMRCTVRDGKRVQWRFGYSDATPLLFVINESGEKSLKFSLPATWARGGQAEDLATSQSCGLRINAEAASLTIPASKDGYHIVMLRSKTPTDSRSVSRG